MFTIMADYTPLELDFFPFGLWTLAGANSDGILYGVSIDERTVQVKLLSYNNFRRSWKILAVSDLPSLPRLIPLDWCYLTSSIYDEQLQRVDVFLECDTSSYILRFITAPEPKFDLIFSTKNDGNISFDGDTGPSLHYCCGRLIVTGSKRGDNGEVFRIFQVLINEEERTFRLVPGWNSNRSSMQHRNRVAAFGNRLFVLGTGGKGFWFTPDTREGILYWPEPTLFKHHHGFIESDHDNYFTVRPALNSSDVIWIVPRSYGFDEATVTPDGVLNTRRVLQRDSPNEKGVYSPTGTIKSAAASATHIFWIQYNKDLDIGSKAFGVPALEYLCLSKLCSTMEEYPQCKSEEEALRLGIPILTWRRYCK